MKTIDLLYLTLIVILLSMDHFMWWPKFLKRSQGEPGKGRIWIWSRWMTMLWIMALAGIAIWLNEPRTWGDLRLILPHGWRLWVAISLVAIYIILTARTVNKIINSKKPARYKMGNSEVERIVPHTRQEFVWWTATSITAGFCEEFIFRGYLVWVFQGTLGLWGAAILSTVLFGLAHSYQGLKGILATGAVGALLILIVLVLNSLWPAIILHALADMGQGLIAYLAFSKSVAKTSEG